MSDSNGGRWQLAFWVVTVICGIGLMTLTTNVIANDRIRQAEDNRIEEKLSKLIETNNVRFMTIMGDLREIKAKMGIRTIDYRGTVNS